MACCRFFPVRRYTFMIDDQSEKRPSRRRTTRPRRRACSTFSAFCISGNVGKGVFKIVSPRFCAFRPRRRVSAAPSRRARKPVKTPLKKRNLKSKEAGFPRSAMARRSLRVAIYLRCTLLTRPEHDLCRRSQRLRIYWASSTHACAASSRDGATAAFLTGRRSKLRTGTLFNFHSKDGSVTNRVI